MINRVENEKGFTLVELLAVIVILAIILAIAVPGISNVINSSTKGAAESDAKMVFDAVRIKQLEDTNLDPTTINETNVESLLGISADNYERLSFKKINGTLYLTIVGKNKWNNLTMSGTKTNIKTSDTVVNFVRGANAPVLTTGMTPIKWNGSAWVDTTASDTAWYNYDTTNKIWANARTADGSMWVWIPRYIYKINTANWHTTTVGSINIQFTKGVDDNWNKASIGAIDIGETANASNNKWTNHPAFTFGDTELTGIWVSKFEASNDGSDNVKVVPNVQSWRSISINDIFTKVRSMETNNVYGWGTTGSGIDTHMMDHTEWGAVTYLAQSTYGMNSEIYKNNSSSFYTGRSGGNICGSQVKVGSNEYIDTGFYTYDGKCATTTTLAPGINANCTSVGATVSDTTLSFKASTTGNIYGIYDMSGGAWEYVSAYVNNGDSGLATNGASILNAASQYKDIYTVGSTDTQVDNYAAAVNKKGEALYETSSSSTISNPGNNPPYTTNPWFVRGGRSAIGSDEGAFSCGFATGASSTIYSFRPIIIIGAGL